MTKPTSALLETQDYLSAQWFPSETTIGVRFAVRRISLAQRIELTKRVKELTCRYDFLRAGNAGDQVEAALSELLAGRLYLEWGVQSVEGLTIDGCPATVELVVEKGPEALAGEMIAAVRAELGLTEEERKNF